MKERNEDPDVFVNIYRLFALVYMSLRNALINIL